VFYEGFVYGLDKGILACIDLEDGSRRWKKGRHGHGQILLSGDLMLVLGESGQLVLAEATPDEYRELGQIEAITGRTWNQHSLVDGIVYVRNHLEMAAYNLRE
jgi:outer membrane protein assembly factor BamB